jgi:LPS export ABC transporter protein LptC
MKSLGSIILGVLFVALIIEIVLIGPMDIHEEKPKLQKVLPGLSPHGEGVEQLMEGIHVIEAKNENKEWELWADHAVGFRDRDDMALKKVRAQFFTESGVTFDVVGAEGSVMAETKNIVVDGGVVTKSSNGYTFKTLTVQYNSRERILKSPSAVEVLGPRDAMGPGLFLKGNHMHADLKSGLVYLQDQVVARKPVQQNRRLTVSSVKAQLSGNDRAVRFSGSVVIDYNGMRITGPDAYFVYGEQSQSLEKIELAGGIRVSDFSKWATSEKLSINLAKNEFVFDGRPRVVQDNDELRGDRIVFLDGGKKVKVQNAKLKVSRESLGQSLGDKKDTK